MIKKLKKESFTAPLLVLAVVALMVLTQNALSFSSLQKESDLFLTYIVLELLIFVLPGVFYVKLKPRGYSADMNLVSFGFSQLPLVVLMFFVMVFGGILASLIYGRLGLNTGDSLGIWQDALTLSPEDPFKNELDVLYLSLALAVVPAFAEEFLFRGVLLREYRSYGMLPSVLITSFFFAMVHFDLSLFPLYFLAGTALGFTAYATRSALASAILHSLYNLFSFFISPLVSNFISLESGKVAVFYVVTVLFLLFLMLVFGEAERLFAGYSTSGLKSAPRKGRVFSVLPASVELISPSFLLCVLLFVLGILNVLPIKG